MRRSVPRAMGLLLLALTVTLAAGATTQRTWTKYHSKVKSRDGGVLAEFTHISTHDALHPTQMRTLLADADDHRVVIRQTLNRQDGSGTVSVEPAGGGESCTFAWTDSSAPTIVTLNGATLEYADAEEGSAAVRARGTELLDSKASAEFQEVLLSVARLGSQTGSPVGFVARRLKGVFFADSRTRLPRGVKETATELIEAFQPRVTPPSSFEEPFGKAYFD